MLKMPSNQIGWRMRRTSISASDPVPVLLSASRAPSRWHTEDVAVKRLALSARRTALITSYYLFLLECVESMVAMQARLAKTVREHSVRIRQVSLYPRRNREPRRRDDVVPLVHDDVDDGVRYFISAQHLRSTPHVRNLAAFKERCVN